MTGRPSALASWLALTLGVACAAAVIWQAGPLLMLQGNRPLDSVWARLALIAAALLLPLLAALWRRWQAWRQAVQPPDAALRAAVDAAVDTALTRLLARSPGGGFSVPGLLRRVRMPAPLVWQAQPWAMVLGTPGADRRRQLAAAGLDLPAAGGAEPPCSLSITARGVVVDVADVLADGGPAWAQLLRRLKKARPLQPVSAVLVLVSASELMAPPAQRAAAAQRLALRLQDLRAALCVAPPVHLTVTGCQRIDGFPDPTAQARVRAALQQFSTAGLDGETLAQAWLAGSEPGAMQRSIDDRGLAPQNPALFDGRALARRRAATRIAYLTITLATAGLSAAWVASRQANLLRMTDEETALATLSTDTTQLAAADTPPLALLLQVLETTRALAAKDTATGWQNGWGLGQGARLDAAAGRAHDRLLQQQLAAWLRGRLAERLRGTPTADAGAVFDALQVYLLAHERGSAASRRLLDLLGRQQPVMRLGGLEQTPAADSARLSADLIDLLQRLGLPAQPPDRLLVETARETLRAYPLERLLLRSLLRQQAAGGDKRVDLAAMAGPQAGVVFARRSGQALNQGPPLLYSLEGIRTLVRPTLDSKLLADALQVMGQPAGGAGNTTPEAGALRLYLANYQRAWADVMADLQLAPAVDATAGRAAAQRLAAADSPLPPMLRALAQQTSVAEALAGLPGADTAATLVDAPFAALHRLTQGDPPLLAATLDTVGQLAQPASAEKARIELALAAQRLPQPLRTMVIQLLAEPSNQPQAAFSALQRACQRMVTRYPLAPAASQEATLQEFVNLFASGSGFDSVFTTHLAPLVDTSAGVWAYRKASTPPPLPAAALASFQQAARIREAFFAQRSTAPAFSLQLGTGTLPKGLQALELRLNERRLSLADGGPLVRIDWPGTPALQQIGLGAPGGRGDGLQVNGTWAMFRLLDALTLQPTRAPGRYTSQLMLNGQAVDLRISIGSAQEFSKASLRQLRCNLLP